MALQAPAATTGAGGLAPFRRALDELLAEGGGPAWLAAARQAAMARAEERGLPTPDDEAWRFTPVGGLARQAFGRLTRAAAVPPDLLAGLRLPVTRELVFVNGRFAPALSTPGAPDGARAESLRDALAREPGLLEEHLGRITAEGGVFADLNAALWEDGALVVIPPGAAAARTIHLLFLSLPPAGAEAPAVHTRTLVLAGRGSQARLVQTWAGAPGGPALTTAVTEVRVEDGAVLDHYRLQQEAEEAYHVSALQVRQGRSSRFADHAVLVGAALSRNEARLTLEGEGAEGALYGLMLARGAQHVDAHTVIDHARPHCSSRELYNGILDGRARGVFHGRIVVRPQAQKTDAHQANHNLLLSREALVNSTPALEIRADDVRCKHGSTTGQLDPEALFYLRSRGLDEAAARAALAYAFAGEVIGRLGEEAVRGRLAAVLRQRLPGVPEEMLA